MQELRGVLPIVATPFDGDEAVDEASLRNLVEFHIGAGAHGLTLLGVAGEIHKLTDAERQQVVEISLDQARGRVPVVVGTGHPSTRVAVQFSQQAERAGAAAVMVIAPYVGVRPDQPGLYEYYRAVAESVGIPIVVQDEPVTSGVILPAPFIARLAEIPNVKYAKVEQVPTPPKFAEIRRLTGGRLGLFGGVGGMYFLEELERGAAGIMTGFGYTEVLVEIFNAHARGDARRAQELFYRYSALLSYETQQGIGLQLRKQVLQWRGLIRDARVRGPAPRIDDETRAELRALIERLGLPLAPKVAVPG
ncbi:MAG: dihydrodipicolinate synthase family protein [Chloroflexi bacterium]|nr:dihydrodipicolinate synthase family protein [Chloroflexota bacterium]